MGCFERIEQMNCERRKRTAKRRVLYLRETETSTYMATRKKQSSSEKQCIEDSMRVGVRVL